MGTDPAARLGREGIEAFERSIRDLSEEPSRVETMRDTDDETSTLPSSRRTYALRLEAALAGVVEDNAKLRAAVAKVPKKCPIFGHTDSTRRRRVDCADEQCRNPECVRYVECEHWSHDLVAALAALAAAEHGVSDVRAES